MAAKPVPDGYNTVSAYLVVKSARQALEFYEKAFGAEPGLVMTGPDGKGVVHAEMRIGNSSVMLGDENPQWQSRSPQTLGGSPVSLHLYVEDTDALFERAVAAGCQPAMPPMDAFWGDRYAKVVDPHGYIWGIATHQEDLGADEMQRRAEKWFAEMAAHGDCEP